MVTGTMTKRSVLKPTQSEQQDTHKPRLNEYLTGTVYYYFCCDCKTESQTNGVINYSYVTSCFFKYGFIEYNDTL